MTIPNGIRGSSTSRLGDMFTRNVAGLATFAPDKMTKTTISRGDFLFAGLNCFEPGQEHALHTHDGKDKLYFILEGTAVVQIGGQSESLSAGDTAFAPSGVMHSMRNPGPGRLIVVVVL